MKPSTSPPTLFGDFSLVPVSERLMWRDALARHVLDGLALPDWKKQEQIEPVNSTIGSLLNRGITDPEAIASHIFNMGLKNNNATN